MIFWDSSAIVPLVVNEKETDYLEKYLSLDTKFDVYWGTVREFMNELWNLWVKTNYLRNGQTPSETQEDR